MKALLLAAGEGTRMRPLTASMPKPLLPVAGRPFLEHSILALKEAGVTHVTILMGWQQGHMVRHFGDGSRLGISISFVKQEERLGTAHAVSMVADTFNEPFLCINGDVFLTTEMVTGLLAFHESHGNSVITVTEVDNPSEFGIIMLDEDRVTGIVEKPRHPESNLANAGIYVFTPGIFDAIRNTQLSRRGEYEITDSLRLLGESETVSGYRLKETWLDMGRPWDLLTVNELLMKQGAAGGTDETSETIISPDATVEEHVILKGQVTIAPGAVIKSGSYIEGPVIIGAGAVVGPNAYIRGCTYLCENTKVGAASEVKNSIIMKNSNVPHHNYVGDSIIGQDCNLGSGTKVANLRLDDRNILAAVKGQRVDTGRRKLGVILGNNVKTGINSVLDCGTIIGENSFIGPGARVHGTIEPDSKIL